MKIYRGFDYAVPNTRDPNTIVSSSGGHSPRLGTDGGPFVPTAPQGELEDWKSLSYPRKVLAGFLTDIMTRLSCQALQLKEMPLPVEPGYVQKVHDGLYSLGRHGLTSSLSRTHVLQLMPKLLVQAKNLGRTEGATAFWWQPPGDTGKAALAGLCRPAGH